MTVPFGIYMRYYFQCDLRKTIMLSFVLSLFFELTQLSGLYFIYPGSYRLFDVDDLLLNTLGGLVGYALAGPIARMLPSREALLAAAHAGVVLRYGYQPDCCGSRNGLCRRARVLLGNRRVFLRASAAAVG